MDSKLNPFITYFNIKNMEYIDCSHLAFSNYSPGAIEEMNLIKLVIFTPFSA